MKSYFPIWTILFLLALTPARADETITASGFAWDKPNITIGPGESVTWNWAIGHTSTSTTGDNCTAGGTDP
ncbi:MAG TPA: hypothetical protein VLR94_01295, partial [Acidobacteriota bacterium]|nr:hypothetical protein [Acidobacteriota bacterium]